MHILFLFLDGIGLGDDDPETNPFAIAEMPTLIELTNGKRWLRDTGQQHHERAIFKPLDPRLNVEGRPQSGSSQAAILTGKNVPQMLGRHYGPKPNEPIRDLLAEENFFKRVKSQGKTAALLDAYPPGLLDDIERGYTLPSSIQYAAIQSGQDLFTLDDLLAERAITAEWTGQPWHEHLGLDQVPIYTPRQAGHRLVDLSRQYDFAFHSHWMTDYVGHRGPFEKALDLLAIFDGVMQGILEKWNDDEGLIIVTSDHGNMEKIGDRKHTDNDVPALIIGAQKEAFAQDIQQLTDLVPRMSDLLLT
jgi:predicted AlkP superfamily pyrophosphatase or phosphodiesterase